MRTNTALLPSYRRHNRIVGAGIAPCLAQMLSHPSTPVYFYVWAAHPSAYATLDAAFDALYPSARTDRAEVEALLRFLNERFGARCPDPSNPWLVETGMAVADDPEATRFWRTSDRPSVRYFLEQNPDYNAGRSLAILVPVGLRTLWDVATRVGLSRIEKALRPRRRGRDRVAG